MISADRLDFLLSSLRCPACGAAFGMKGNSLSCSTGHTFPIEDDIPMLAKDEGYHFLTPTREQMSRAIHAIDTQGFLAGIETLCTGLSGEAARDLHHYMLNESRGAWKILLPDIDRKRVLDCGCGWGNLAAALARSASVVCGLDLTADRVRFASRRTKHEGLENAHFVCGGDALRLPFADGSFDVVVLNGVLEWIPTSSLYAGDPRAAQLAFLREIARITGPAGKVCIAIENRIGLKYLYGAKDEHTGLKWITPLPRWLADAYSRRRRGQSHREYTHTLGGLEALTQEAGFGNVKAYLPFPNYRSYDYLIPYDGAANLMALMRRARKMVRITAEVVGRMPFLANAFVIFAGKQTETGSAPIAQLAAAADIEPESHGALRVLSTDAVLFFGRQRGSGRDVVCKVPLTPRARASIDAARAHLGQLRSSKEVPEWLRQLVSEPLGQVVAGKEGCDVQSRLPGVTGAELGRQPDLRASVLRTAVRLLARLHSETTVSATLSENLMSEWAGVLLTRGAEMLARVSEPGRAVAAIRGALVGREMPRVLVHGDYWLKNLLFDPATLEITGVLDWDRMRWGGPPLLDLVHLVQLSRRLRGQGFRETVASLAEEWRDPAADSSYGEYLRIMPLSPELLRPLMAFYYLARLPEESPVAVPADAELIASLLA